MLDDLDKELQKSGYKFVRYADDCNIYVKTRRAGERVIESVKGFLEKKPKLKVNPKNSKVDRAIQVKFLGFSFYKHKGEVLTRVANRSLKAWCQDCVLLDEPLDGNPHVRWWARRRLVAAPCSIWTIPEQKRGFGGDIALPALWGWQHL